MARNEDIERRLLNWARWRIGSMSGGLGYASVKLQERVDGGDGYDAPAIVPTVDCEAAETDEGVMALESRLRAAVEAVYIAGGGMRSKAERLCCSEATLKQRIWEAHRRLSAWLAERHAKAQAERQRVERLQRSVAG